jgi:dolichol-phosphate mannosyltransferase
MAIAAKPRQRQRPARTEVVPFRNGEGSNEREDTSMARISLVIPVYNEEACLRALLDRLYGLKSPAGDDYEYVFIDDGSRDRSLEILVDEAHRNPAVKVLALSRNFGHQVAITAGLDYASGDAVVIMDADLQDPPELVHEMAAKWREGYDVVYAQRSVRHGEGFFKKATASIFYRLLGRIAGLSIPRNTGDFRLISRHAVESMRGLRERHRFMRGLSVWIGFPQTCVQYERAARVAGETKYGLTKMFRLAVDAIISFSWVPLRLAFYAGFAAISLCGLYVLVAVFLWAFTDRVLPGWLSLAALITFLGSFQLLTLGIIGEYIGRILDEVKARPLYFLRETVNVSPDQAGPVGGGFPGLHAGHGSGAADGRV